MKTSNLNGYYLEDDKRLALVKSFHEGLTIRYFDDPLNVQRRPHSYAGHYRCLSFDAAIATGLHDAIEYVDQVRRYPIVDKLIHEPKLALLLLDPSQYRPDISLRRGHGSGAWLKSVYVQVNDQSSAVLTFRATFTYFSHTHDEDREVEVNRGIAVPRGLVDNYDLATYRKWLKGALKKAKDSLTAPDMLAMLGKLLRHPVGISTSAADIAEARALLDSLNQ